MLGKSILLALLAASAFVLVRRLGRHRGEEIPSLLQDGRFEEAFTATTRLVEASDRDAGLWVKHGQAALMTGRFAEAARAFRRAIELTPADPTPREGLCLALSLENPEDLEAIRQMEETIQAIPAIQEFQALRLAHLLLRAGRREEALRIFDDNLVLLQTRFEMDYTDPDPMLADVVYELAVLSDAAGEASRARDLREKVVGWAPGSVFAAWSRDGTP